MSLSFREDQLQDASQETCLVSKQIKNLRDKGFNFKMTKKVVILLWCCTSVCFSQNDSIVKKNKLDEVLVVGRKQQLEKKLGKKTVIIDSDQKIKNPNTLTNLLRYNSPIVFRDYGNGGVSTAKFRGTSATNTLVLWNGIPINAFGTGQTDFNALSANISDEIVIQSGGGSVVYGSGAIGGTINLSDKLEYQEHKDFNVFTSYGSFQTSSNFFSTNIGDQKWAVKLASTYNRSENDYPYIDEHFMNNGNLFTNENGQYENYGITFAIGHQFSNNHQLALYTTGYYGNRFFSNGLPNPSAGNERNEDFNQRNLLKWKLSLGDFDQTVNASYTQQRYNFYQNVTTDVFSFGSSNTSRLAYDLTYKFSEKIKTSASFISEFTKGETDIVTGVTRTSNSFLGGLFYKSMKGLETSLEVRKELNSDFDVPLLVDFSSDLRLNNYITFKGSISSNYRVPTFNELYWPVVGNTNLVPEQARQGELGVAMTSQGFKLQTMVFFIRTDDKILWRPSGGVAPINENIPSVNNWRPFNISTTVNKGVETYLSYHKLKEKHQFRVILNYTYTSAKEMATHKFLRFVPEHAANINIELIKNRGKLYTQTLYQSKVFTNEINIKEHTLDPVFVNNLGLDYDIYDRNTHKMTIGAKVNNILNQLYYFSNLRPMPGRNYAIQINYKF